MSVLKTGKVHKQRRRKQESTAAPKAWMRLNSEYILSFYCLLSYSLIFSDCNHTGQGLGLIGSMYNLHSLRIIVQPRAYIQQHAFPPGYRLGKYNEQDKMSASTLEVPLEFWPSISRFMSLLTTELFQ